MQEKEIWIACGGTGGHFMPGVVVGKSLMKRGVKVVFWGEGKVIEENLMEAQQVEMQRPTPGSRWKRLKEMREMMNQMAKTNKPDACLCFGGFSSLALGTWSIFKGVPYHLFEQNAFPGRVNRFLAPLSKTCHLTFPLEGAKLLFSKCYHTGNPVRKIGVNPEIKERDLLILGGSQGAKSLNCELPKLIKGHLNVLHICGPGRLQECEEAWRTSAFEGEFKILESHANIPELLASSKWTISRAGATSICEMVGAKVGCIAVPYPFAKDDHQRANARYLESKKGTYIFEEKTFEDKAEWLNNLLNDDDACQICFEGLEKAGLDDSEGLKALDVILS